MVRPATRLTMGQRYRSQEAHGKHPCREDHRARLPAEPGRARRDRDLQSRPGDVSRHSADRGGSRRRLQELGAKVWDPSKGRLGQRPLCAGRGRGVGGHSETHAGLGSRARRRQLLRHAGHLPRVLPSAATLPRACSASAATAIPPWAARSAATWPAFGATEMAGVMVDRRDLDCGCPRPCVCDWSGELADGVTAKDIMLFLCRALGMENSLSRSRIRRRSRRAHVDAGAHGAVQHGRRTGRRRPA